MGAFETRWQVPLSARKLIVADLKRGDRDAAQDVIAPAHAQLVNPFEAPAALAAVNAEGWEAWELTLHSGHLGREVTRFLATVPAA
ncbi:hypothetical protein ABC766_21665 [Methylobacterium fujisawaense]|uniref:hypothetical protein n=1 Tax=Methylobacterium fujisawaense TaxID=107400 RepID=UPI0031F4CB6C